MGNRTELLKKIIALTIIFFFLTPSQFFSSLPGTNIVQAASKTLTSRLDFDAGSFSGTESKSKEGEVKLTPAGSWGPRVLHTPHIAFNDQTALTTDGTLIYALVANDSLFLKYIPVENRWVQLANAPYFTSVGSDLIVLGNYVYAMFGGNQIEFARYSIATNTWAPLENFPDLVASGSSLATDGTSIFALRGNSTSDFWKYNPATNTWSVITSPPATICTGASLVYSGGYLYTPRGCGTQTFYRYSIAAGTWSTMTNVPGTINEDHTIDVGGGYIYVSRDQNTQTFYRYQISGDSWGTLANTPQTTRYVGLVYLSADNLVYYFRGNNTYDFWKYNPSSNTFLGPTDLLNTPGTGSDLLSYNSVLYYLRGNGSSNFYSYIPASGTYNTLTSAPNTFGDDTKGVVAAGKLYFMRGSNTLTFYVYDPVAASWTQLADAPATIQNGGSLMYPGSGNYIYATRGGFSRSFYRYSISGNTWDDPGAADLPDDAEAAYGSRLFTDGTDIFIVSGNGVSQVLKYSISGNTWTALGDVPFNPYYGTDVTVYAGKAYMLAGYYKPDLWEYTISGNTWRKLGDLPGNYMQNIGPYNGASLESDGAGTLYYTSGQNFTQLQTYTIGSAPYVSSGTWISDVLDLSYVSQWTSFTASATTPANSTIGYETRTSSDRVTWSAWGSVTGSTISSAVSRYIQVRATLTASTGSAQTPTLSDITISYSGDTAAPTNPTSFTGSSQSTNGVALTSGYTYSYSYPYFTWTGAADSETGVSGYYVYFGTSQSADPQTLGSFQTTNTYVATTPMTNGTYYLRLKTQDAAGNISAAGTGFTYVYKGANPATFTQTTTADFSAGTTTNISTASDKLQLSTKPGFWQQDRVSLAPAGLGYGSNFAYVASSNKLYTFRGQNTTTFYEYNIATDTWTTKAVAPLAVNNGGELVEGPSGYLYAARGQNTTTFWRYDIANDTWSDVAASDAPQPFDYGAALLFDGSHYIYALKGNSDDTFMRYDTLSDTWDVLNNTDFGAPAYQPNNLVYNGGDLTYDGQHTIYAIQGNGRSGFAAYSIVSGTWSRLGDLPALANYGAQLKYDGSSNALYFFPGWDKTAFYKYSFDTQSWSELPEAPSNISSGASMRIVNGIIYVERGGGSQSFYKYNIAKSSWAVPTRGILGSIFRNTEYFNFGYGADIIKGDGNNYYLTQGNYNNLFYRYNGVTGEVARMADPPVGFYLGGKLVYDSLNNNIYATATQYLRRFYVYSIATDTWTDITTDPPPIDVGPGTAMTFDSARYIYLAPGNGSANFYRYDLQAAAGSRWGARASAPGGMSYGAELVIKGSYIYALRGNNTLSFYRYDMGSNTWSDPAVADLPSGALIYNDGFLVDGGGDILYACRGGNVNLCYQYSISGNSWSAIANAPANITAGGSAASDGANKLLVIAGTGTNTYGNGLYTYIMQTASSSFQEAGSFTSSTHDLGSVYRYANLSLGWTPATNSAVTVATRTSADTLTWSSWSDASEQKSLSSVLQYKISSPVARYMQVKITLTSADGVYSGAVNDYTISYYQDTVNPTNPSALSAYSSATQSAQLSANTWYNHAAPFFSWPAVDAIGGASDTATGSGIMGYYVYFGIDSAADPITRGTFTQATSYTASSLTSGNTYYLRLKAKDDAGNTASSAWDAFSYKYDSASPTNPTTIVVNPPGYTATNSFNFSWMGATDSASLVEEYCYKTGAVGASDTCTQEASASAVLAYQTGTNTFYLRTKDTAGNYTSDYATASYYYNSTAPTPPRNLIVTPSTNSVNEFAFTWSPPLSYYGTQDGIRYYYSINELPKSSNVNKIGLSQTYLSQDAYATRKGTNTLYVVAKDEAGNIDYNLYASVDFTADTSAPSAPTNIDIADVSIKETNSWRLALTWDPPTATGSGVAVYKVYRSATPAAVCTASSLGDFAYVSSTTTTSFIDSQLQQQTYNYCVKSCDSTGECSAPSDTVKLYPDGKWRVAPDLVASISATVKTKSAIINWSTNRTANSFVKYGKESGTYTGEAGSSEQVVAHEIALSALDPGTTYYYQVLWTDEDGNTGKSPELTFATADAPFISAVKIQNISINSAYVTFKVKNAIKATVQYGKTLAYGASDVVTTSLSESTYTLQLTNLIDAQVYHLRVAAADDEGNIYNGDDYTFETLPVPKILNFKIQQVVGMPTATVRLLWNSNTPISTVVTYYPTNNPTLSKDFIALAISKTHEVLLRDLVDDSEYAFVVKGRDAAGNEAAIPVQKVKTSVDFRPPAIDNLTVESTIVGVGDQARAQILISWDTDEPATTQVEYAEGTGTAYSSSTQEDSNKTTNHNLTIPGLLPSKIYHLRVSSKDKAGNLGQSPDTVIITPSSTKDALSLVIDNLSKTFGFLKGMSGK